MEFRTSAARVLDFYGAHPAATARTAAIALGLTERTVYVALGQLEANGYIRTEFVGRGAVRHLTELALAVPQL